jgi:hypothetical protein
MLKRIACILFDSIIHYYNLCFIIIAIPCIVNLLLQKYNSNTNNIIAPNQKIIYKNNKSLPRNKTMKKKTRKMFMVSHFDAKTS